LGRQGIYIQHILRQIRRQHLFSSRRSPKLGKSPDIPVVSEGGSYDAEGGPLPTEVHHIALSFDRRSIISAGRITTGGVDLVSIVKITGGRNGNDGGEEYPVPFVEDHAGNHLRVDKGPGIGGRATGPDFDRVGAIGKEWHKFDPGKRAASKGSKVLLRPSVGYVKHGRGIGPHRVSGCHVAPGDPVTFWISPVQGYIPLQHGCG